MPFVDVNGQRIHYTDQGKGLPVVFSGSLMSDTQLLQPLAGALADAGYRAIAFDPRAQGQTRFNGEPFTFVDSARDMLGVAEALGIERAVFGGELIGPTVALQAALLEPDRVEGLLLIGPTADPTDPAEMVAVESAMRVLKESGPTDGAFGHVAYAMTGDEESGAALLARWITWTDLQQSAQAWLGRPDLTGELGTITCPAVVIHGRNEFYVPLKYGKKVAENLGGETRFEVIEGQHQALSILRLPETLEAVQRLMGELFPVSTPKA